jgi:D-alanyl-D-alanine carboxypeptidase
LLWPLSHNSVAPREKQKAALRLLFCALCFLVVGTFVFPQTAEARRYASIVVETATGRVLHESGADRQAYPASMTKMMTLLMLFDAIEGGKFTKDSRLKVSRRAAGMPPSKLGLKPGSTIAVDDAIRALVTKSANDVAVVVAEAISGSESSFAVAMTKKARDLGMSRTTFRNASGLPDTRQLSTARDMATLSTVLIRQYPTYYDYFRIKSFTYNGRTYKNHNKLLDDYPGVDGLKTGYIRASGFNLAASAVRGGQRIVAVVFGGKTSRSRNAHMITLLDRGFSRVQVARNDLPSAPPPEKPLLASAQSPSPDIQAAAAAPAVEVNGMVVLPALRPSLAQDDIHGEGDYDEGPINSFGIQVGAFTDPIKAQEAARTATDSAPAHLLGRELRITRVESGKSVLYRARLLGMQVEEAEAACSALKLTSRVCIVVKADPLDLAAVQQ